ncbi:hypothetical protein YC2023_117219 [Brassica napus]
MPILLKSDQSASREEAVEKRKKRSTPAPQHRSTVRPQRRPTSRPQHRSTVQRRNRSPHNPIIDRRRLMSQNETT